MSGFSFSISVFVSRVQHFRFAIEPFKLFLKDRHFHTKAAIKNWLPLLFSIIIAGCEAKFYANRVNSWLVIQNFRGPCKIQAHGAILL